MRETRRSHRPSGFLLNCRVATDTIVEVSPTTANQVSDTIWAYQRASASGRTHSERSSAMPRYLVERTFPDGLDIPMNDDGANICLTVVGNNLQDNVTWVHSYVTGDKKKTFCIYDAPSPEAIRKAAQRNNLPVDRITQVSVLDPYFYQ